MKNQERNESNASRVSHQSYIDRRDGMYPVSSAMLVGIYRFPEECLEGLVQRDVRG